jgi:hypothetical protein
MLRSDGPDPVAYVSVACEEACCALAAQRTKFLERRRSQAVVAEATLASFGNRLQQL